LGRWRAHGVFALNIETERLRISFSGRVRHSAAPLAVAFRFAMGPAWKVKTKSTPFGELPTVEARVKYVELLLVAVGLGESRIQRSLETEPTQWLNRRIRNSRS